MPMFRKKPVVVSASQWFEVSPERPEVELVRHTAPDRSCEHCGKSIMIHGWIDTLESGHVVCPGDWIITGVKGERYPCKPEIFALTYEPAA